MLIVLISVSILAVGLGYEYLTQRNKLKDLQIKFNATKIYADDASRKILDLEEKVALSTIELAKVNTTIKDQQKQLANANKPVQIAANNKPAMIREENTSSNKNRRRSNNNKDNKQK